MSVQHYPAFGGPHNELIRLEPGLNAAGVATTAVLTSDPGNAVERLVGAVDLRVIKLGRMRQTKSLTKHLRFAKALGGDIRRLRAEIRCIDPDLVKVHGPHNPQGAIAAALEKVPVVWVISSTRTPQVFRGPGMVLVRFMAASVLSNGASLLDHFPGGGGVRHRCVAYFPPVDVRAFQPGGSEDRRVARNALGIRDGETVVGTIANVTPQKGIELFLEAAAHIATRIQNTIFPIIGHHDYEAHEGYGRRMKDLAASLGISDRVRFVGARSDVAGLLHAFDVKVISSVPASEGTTTTSLEAMACGIPVVATDVGAVREGVLNGKTGFVVPPGDPAIIAAKVAELLRNPTLRDVMGRAGRAEAVARFSTESCVRQHLIAYDRAQTRGPAVLRRGGHWRG